MNDSVELKKISKEAITGAIEKADHYRLLNDPEQAESICLDVLEIEPDNQRALITVILSVTDQFASDTAHPSPAQAKAYVARLDDEYQRRYYSGLISEREARAVLARGGMTRSFAYDGFRAAMDKYLEAAEVRPKGNDDPLLRWNSCVRTIRREKLQPRVEDRQELPLE